MTIRWSSFALGALALFLLGLLVALLVILTGGYNVAATERHTPVGAWALNTNFVNSVQGHAADITAPELTRAMVDAGAPEYKSMCAHCHGGVGESRAGWAEGMRPKPPALARVADQWSASEVYWLVDHGAKMTGMPAFGATHDEETMWNITAFVKAMPRMGEAQYAAYSSEHGGGSEEAGHSHAPGTEPHED
ncbi:c-type cytochrome [Aurantiacibacter hainanensis]|uniref:c-type cytochrome n=1 Tax=Aurantiacibacter hainanensis TaxID=3076114 RepID=UPI0030C68C57